MNSRSTALLALLAVSTGAATPGRAIPFVRSVIAILVSPGAEAYREASQGAVESLRSHLADMEVETIQLERSEDVARGERLLAERPKLVIAVGSKAAKLAQTRAPDVPLVYAMVLEPASVGLPTPGEKAKEGATGVTMDVSAEQQFDLLQQILPQARRIGVLYDPAISGQAMRRAAAAAKTRGLELVAQTVREEGEVMAAATLLVPQVDALWALADPTVLTAANARGLILLSLRSRKPLFAMSAGYVRSGALAALAPDAREVGRRAGELARRALAGSAIHDLSPESPPIPLDVYLNRATAERLGVLLPAVIVARARTVFPEQ